MKVSVNLAQHYSKVDLESIPTEVMLRKIGAQLGAVEDVEYWGPRYDGIYVAKVVSCEPHPDSDHMHICMLDDGGVVKGIDRSTEGHVQVVCGAPNIASGQTVAWLAPGSTVPASHGDKEPFVLGSRNLRGVMSNGMIGSIKELGLGEDHGGILIIDVKEVGEELTRPGTEFKKLYGCDDVVIDCENKMFTHRPDCFGVLGVARELAGINGLTFESPEWYKTSNASEATTNELGVNIANGITAKVPRFMVQSIEGVTNGSSPIWLQAALTRMGSRPISALVDQSNFYMQLTSQPTHAFDYDKLVTLAGKKDLVLSPRMAKKGESIALLNGKTIELHEDDIVITCNDIPVALGGVMGGSETECDKGTKNIVIECATFDMYTIRRTSMRHGLFTDAVTRYNKGQSSRQNDKVLAQLVHSITQQCGGVAGQVMDSYIAAEGQLRCIFSLQKVNDLLGTVLTSDEVNEILQRVEFIAVPDSDAVDTLQFEIPFWRTDISTASGSLTSSSPTTNADIAEEIGRLYGYDKLPMSLPARTAKPVKRNELLDFKNTVRNTLAAKGANEVLTYSFVHGDLLRKTGTDPEKWAYHVRNALSPDLQYYRTSLISSLVDKVHMNIRADYVRGDDNEFAIFEIGKAHVKGHDMLDDESVDPRPNKQKLPIEFERVAFVVAADEKTSSRKHSGSAYYLAKKYLTDLTHGEVHFEPLTTNDYPITSAYQLGRSATVSVGDELLGVIGEFKADVKKALKLPDFSAGFELDLRLLMGTLKSPNYQAIGAFPKISSDLTLEVAADVLYHQVIDCIRGELDVQVAKHSYQFSLGPRDIFETNGKIRYTFRVWLWHRDKTLVTAEANAVLDRLAAVAAEQVNAVRI